MRIPKRVDILGSPTKVVYTGRELALDDGEVTIGMAHVLTDQISINHTFEGEHISEHNQATILLHEILHHIDFKLHLDLTEEQVVGCSVALLQVIRANKLDFLNCSDSVKPTKRVSSAAKEEESRS